MKSVVDVLQDVKSRGFSRVRWGALYQRWAPVCKSGPVWPTLSLEPWGRWLA